VGRRPGTASGGLQAEPTIGKAIDGGYDLLEAKWNKCGRVALVLLRPEETTIRKLEVALYCEPCSAGRPFSHGQRAHILGLTYPRPDPCGPLASFARR
jgi:hypothetical protein